MRIPMMRLATILLLLGCAACSAARPHWYQGNLHTHSLWSDGDQFPEVALQWYKDHRYDFVSVSDHNVLARGERWLPLAARPAREAAFAEYRRRFGDGWVETRRDSAGGTEVRLKSFEEYARLLGTNSFLVIEAEEITDRFDGRPLHVNATNVAELIPPQGGTSVSDVLQRNIDAVREQRLRTGQLMFPHVNHPNFGWAVTAEDLIPLQGERFFEVYNGHPAVHNDGDALRPSMDRLWDIVLATRLSAGDSLVYGIATDDAHNYGQYDSSRANPGRGWVMVRAGRLSADSIIVALERGDFYATSGVELSGITAAPDGITIRIRAEPGVSYVTQFVGTRRGYDRTTAALPDVDHLPVTRRYSNEIGVVLAEVAGPSASYRFRGDELYVRARIRSTKPKDNPVVSGEVERAWTQPLVPGVPRR